MDNTVCQNIWVNPELEEQPHQVGGLTPNRFVQISGKPSEALDLQTTILEIFARRGIRGKLLILGEPGGGKTTRLLTLADQLVQQSLLNLGTAIPVIFELSTWKDDNQSIHDWLVEQLKEIYRLPSKVTRCWLKNKLLVPLLDGLDELGLERQRTCVQRINEFAENYPRLVVCCRAEEYSAGNLKLNELSSAVRLQPLNPTQIQEYLQQVGQRSLWEAVVTQPEMQSLLHPDSEGKPGIF